MINDEIRSRLPVTGLDFALPYQNNLLDPNKFENGGILNTLLENLRTNIQNTVDTVAENLKISWENYKENQKKYQAEYETVPLFKLNLNPQLQENEIIHEEFAVKERRIRELERDKIEKDERVKELEVKIEKLENNPFLKWWQRATEDSKKERIM